MQTIKKLLAACFALVAFGSVAAVLNPILLIHGIKPNISNLPKDDYGTWLDYYANLNSNQGASKGGVWQAISKGGIPSGAQCLDPCPTDAYANDVFIARFTDGSELTFAEQGGEIAAILAAINTKRVANSKPAAKFSLVTHSMGGLAGRFYIQNLHTGPSPYAGDVARLITVGTPHKGLLWALVCAGQDYASIVAAASREIGGLDGVAIALVATVYKNFCESNTAILALAPTSALLNVMHQCTANNAVDCGDPSGMASLGLQSVVRSGLHALPLAIEYHEFIVRISHKSPEFCSGLATYHELDSAHANSTPSYASCSSYNSYGYTADGDDLVSSFSQSFWPPVRNGSLPALPILISKP